MDPIQEKKIDIMREHVITVFSDNTFLEAFTIFRLKKNKNPIGQTHWLWACCKIHPKTGLKIATDIVANAADIIFLPATKNSGCVATLATRFLYDLDLK